MGKVWLKVAPSQDFVLWHCEHWPSKWFAGRSPLWQALPSVAPAGRGSELGGVRVRMAGFAVGRPSRGMIEVGRLPGAGRMAGRTLPVPMVGRFLVRMAGF